MTRLEGKEYHTISEEDYLIRDLIKEGQIRKINGEYSWTIKSSKILIKNFNKLKGEFA